MIDKEDADWIKNNVKEEIALPEAPASANVKLWIDGFGVMVTMRGTKVFDIINEVIVLVKFAQEKGWKNTWDDNTKPVVSFKAPSSVTDAFGACPKCGSPLVEKTTKDGKVMIKCSTNTWNWRTKKAEGCSYVKWKD